MITLQESPGFFNRDSPNLKEDMVDRGGEDMEDSPPRVVQDEESTPKADTPANTSIIMRERKAINQPYVSISPAKSLKTGFSMMYRNQAQPISH